MTRDGRNKPCTKGRRRQKSVDVEKLVRIIGYQLTAFIGSTDVRTVARWLHGGVPKALQSRMQAALEIAEPIERVESELVAQGFLAEEMCGLAPYLCAAEMLRAADVRIARAVLTKRARKEFLENVAADLDGIEPRLRTWISKARLPPRNAYSVHLSPDRNRLWLQLIHTGYPVDQQRKWDRGEEWPCWDEVIQAIPEIATARTIPDLQTGFPFKYLRRAIE